MFKDGWGLIPYHRRTYDTTSDVEGHTSKYIKEDMIHMDPVISLNVAKGESQVQDFYKENKAIRKILSLITIYWNFTLSIIFSKK